MSTSCQHKFKIRLQCIDHESLINIVNPIMIRKQIKIYAKIQPNALLNSLTLNFNQYIRFI